MLSLAPLARSVGAVRATWPVMRRETSPRARELPLTRALPRVHSEEVLPKFLTREQLARRKEKEREKKRDSKHKGVCCVGTLRCFPCLLPTDFNISHLVFFPRRTEEKEDSREK